MSKCCFSWLFLQHENENKSELVSLMVVMVTPGANSWMV